ncbi:MULTISPECIES: WxL domain-containing protein [Listeria]|uniref:WxL domain-containing protein n=1 Tax=Listeria TaxID=1637 RepID=UPI000B588DFF|nr:MULTISPECIES: WxL domain-containing protein [Listeria]
MNKGTKWLVASAVLTTAIFSESIHVLAVDGGSITSDADLTYEKNTSTTNPIDPTEPGNVITPDPDNPGQPGTAGPLSIDFASNLRFGLQKMSGKQETYYAHLTKVVETATGAKKEVPNYVQVTDNRGSNGGWHLTVKQNGQLMNGANALEGAQISLLNSTLVTLHDGNVPTANTLITLDPVSGDAVEIVNAQAGTGSGTWANLFGKDVSEAATSVKLVVPGKTQKVEGQYKTTLTFELVDSPA